MTRTFHVAFACACFLCCPAQVHADGLIWTLIGSHSDCLGAGAAACAARVAACNNNEYQQVWVDPEPGYCVSCIAGMRLNGTTSNPTCTSCPSGQYRGLDSVNRCLRCPGPIVSLSGHNTIAGMTSIAGSASIRDCTPLPNAQGEIWTVVGSEDFCELNTVTCNKRKQNKHVQDLVNT